MKIFVTVGEQLPFTRLIRTVDEWAATSGEDVFAQIGKSDYLPHHIEYTSFLTPKEFKNKLLAADIVVAHAGMGTIITALEFGKPILIMPRQQKYGEVRNDHQVSTAKRFLALRNVTVAFDEKDLMVRFEKLAVSVSHPSLTTTINPSPILIKTLIDFIKKS